MTLRVCHVPSIVSLRQLHEDAGGASPTAADAPAPSCSWLDGSTALANAVGACVPLYQYPPAVPPSEQVPADSRSVSRSSSMSGCSEDDARVPDYLGLRIDEDAWAPKQAVFEMQQQQVLKHLQQPAAVQQQQQVWSLMTPPPMFDTTLLGTVPNNSQHKQLAVSEEEHDSSMMPPSLMMDSSELASTPSASLALMDEDEEDDLMQLSSPPISPVGTSNTASSSRSHQRTAIDTVLTALWDDCAARGLFRYDVSACASKVLPGRWGWVAQLNEGRASKKRPTELRVDAVLQPFDAAKFHFGKAFLREVLLQFEPLGSQQAAAAGDGSGLQAWAASASGARMMDSSSMTADPTLVMINVSPIDYGHVLLTPRVLSQLPQRLEPHGLAAALAFVREVGNPSFRLGFNSLGAYATINHLHFQGYYLDAVLPCERAATTLLPGWQHPTLRVSTLADYPVQGWVVDMLPAAERNVAEVDMAALLHHVAHHLQSSDQPFNLLLVDQGKRAFIWPQCYAERQAAGVVPEELLDTGVNPAVFEVAGHLVLKRAQDYQGATDEWAARLLAGVSLSVPRFAALTAACFYGAAAAAPSTAISSSQ